MLDFGFYNMDCMEGMKAFPDNYFDLAIVDPPYGDGAGDGGGGTDLGNASTGTKPGGGAISREAQQKSTIKEQIVKERTAPGVSRIGGTWAEKYTKKL